ncbi:hypothetical protein SteCoe_9131 [Stentor coeruleus]|uniref:Palmitoyltransferase n=1 Tax=Stentor coeruleus TaxID=5963 RepID=A0A1R2CIH3_9CILI|nr:hypothetical protein SteCoe_9131 [Stentor coeruleus]
MEIESSKGLRKNFGHLKCFGFIGGEPLFCIGPHWPFFLCLFTFLLIIGLFFICFVSPSISSSNTIIGVSVFCFLLINFLMAALINPGIEMRTVRDEDLEPDEPDNFCSICEVYKSNMTEHCDDCGVCVQEYDHHCPWTGKCIGRGNINFFYSFLFGLLICFLYCIVTMAMTIQEK